MLFYKIKLFKGETKMKKRVMSLALSVLLGTSLLAGCGEQNTNKPEATNNSKEAASNTVATTETKYKDFITVDVFNAQGNYQGIQPGWFAKIVKDKFNMELNMIAPNVAGGGDTLFQTRSAAGNLGDLIINSAAGGKLQDLVTAGLVMDMTDLIKDKENLNKYKDSIEFTNQKMVKETGIWCIPSEVSELSPSTSQDGADLNFGAYIRWDLYKAMGYPEMKTFEDLLPIMKEMQDKAGTSDSGEKVYAFSIFKDWDGDLMNAASQIPSFYGYGALGFAFAKADDSAEPQSAIEDDSLYIRSLKFYYKANQMGLLDPDSTTQNFDTLDKKYQDGSVLFSPWPWLGQTKYNTDAHKAEGKGFMVAPIEDQQIYAWGCYAKGNPNNAIMIGSKAQDPERLADFIEWLYSPEGISISSMGVYTGQQGVTWDMKDGQPELTDFGKDCIINQTVEMPAELGGGIWRDGKSELNFKTVAGIEINPETGFPYNYNLWDSFIKAKETDIERDWQSHMKAKNPVDYFTQHNQMVVAPGSGYATPEEDSAITTLRSQCKAIIVQCSWQAIYAKDDAEFDSIIKEMQDTVKGLGYDEVLAVDMKNIEARKQAAIDVLK